jgi:hypothetical protein
VKEVGGLMAGPQAGKILPSGRTPGTRRRLSVLRRPVDDAMEICLFYYEYGK